MQVEDNKVSRRKLLGWLGVVSLFSAAGAALIPWKSEKKPATVKMLTQDGQLVEIDAALLAANTTKVSDKELQNWVKGK